MRFMMCGAVLWVAGCGASPGVISSFTDVPDAGEVTLDTPPDGGAPAAVDSGSADPDGGVITPGAIARVIAGTLNLRGGAGTTNPILAVMPCAARVNVLGGPSSGWWNVRFNGTAGWASGKYLVAESAFDPAVCAQPDGGVAAMPDGSMPNEVADIFTCAKLGVGYSYFWGHGSWRADGAQPGACTGSCPNCTHTGQYGADCSGYVAKCWQVPSPSPLPTDLHPYSSYNFYNQTTHWKPVPRSQIQPADSLVYNANGQGHMGLFDSGMDPWGSIWFYEARGCATGVQHNLRAVSSSFIAIRRDGL